MKKFTFLFGLVLILLFSSCDLLNLGDSVKGDQSPIGEVGTEIYTSSIAGVENPSMSVTSLENGISTITAQATVTNPLILNVLSNLPECTVNGNTVSGTAKFKITTEGIESENDSYSGVLVKYSSKAGDTYKGASGYKREVVSKSTEDDYSFGFYLIKVLEIEESPCSVPGVKKLVYFANHKFGIVGAEVTYDDNTTMNIGLSYSAQND